MRLIDVTAILGIESNIDQGKEVDTTTEIFGEFDGADLEEKEYAILSHCWGVAKQREKEVSFKEMNKLCRQAQWDGLEWVWIDTCCIDKKSSSELHDTVGDSRRLFWKDRREPTTVSKWFSRGWTLQELIAPKVVHFFDQKWEWIGDRAELAHTLSQITRIPEDILKNRMDFESPSVAQIMSWAADRTTTREEDRAYSLLGLLGVHMPMLYGEGKNAFRRLQLEIIRTSNDQSIFAWGLTRKFGWSSSILADDPSCFRGCDKVTALEPGQFTQYLGREGMSDEKLSCNHWSVFRGHAGVRGIRLDNHPPGVSRFHLVQSFRHSRILRDEGIQTVPSSL